MTDSNKDIERGEKRGVLSTGRAKDHEDASADADNEDDDTDTSEED